jgi:hypothetical protein
MSLNAVDKAVGFNPLDAAVDKATIGGRLTPGICEIVGADSPRAWDELQGYGLSGATVRFHGIKLSHFSLKFRLYTSQDWADWHVFKPLIDKPPVGRYARSLDCAHPILADLGIRSIVIENVLAPEQTDDGEWTIELKVIEFRRPKGALGTPEGSTATPVDPYDQKIEARVEHLVDLMAAP